MWYEEWFILMAMGGFFILLGLGMLFWGRSEEKSYYNSLSRQADVREYLEHSPERPALGALQIGGWVTVAIGLVVLAIGGAFLLWS